MKLKSITNYFLFFLGLSLFLVSCDSDDSDDDGMNPEPSYTVPETYVFEDENGNNTVSYSGQADRLNQLEEMTTRMKSANDAEVALNGQNLLDMFANVNGDGGGNFSFTSSKELRNKCAAAFSDAETVREEFEEWMEELGALSQNTNADSPEAENGIAGILIDGESGPYLVNENGVELTQYIEKGLMGAVFYHQITEVYLTDARIGEGVNNTDPENPAEGKYYTAMEHHWDEAFGYFTTEPNYPVAGTDRFWGKYSNTVNEQLESNQTIMNAFLTGRAAISNGDMATKNEQRDIIITELERVVAATAIHYLNGARDNFANLASRNHQLSEAVAFIDDLRFNSNGVLSPLEINDLKADLGTNFYETSVSQINSVRDQLSAAYGMDEFKSEL